MQEGLPQALRDAKQAQLDALSGNKSGLLMEKRAKKYDRIYKSVMFIGASHPLRAERRSPARAQHRLRPSHGLHHHVLRSMWAVEGEISGQGGAVKPAAAEAQP